MFTRITPDPASPTEEVSISFFYESLQIAFPNDELVSKFQDKFGKSLQSLRELLHRREGRGEQSSLAFKGT